ncbi:hypothetical protein QL285_077113 [Trifolium repens]|nr:hypothetical protein QL285_077113 [Trifolium repens]
MFHPFSDPLTTVPPIQCFQICSFGANYFTTGRATAILTYRPVANCSWCINPKWYNCNVQSHEHVINQNNQSKHLNSRINQLKQTQFPPTVSSRFNKCPQQQYGT